MTTLIKLSLENFFAIEKEEICFDHGGVSLVTGENGSSKTTLFIEGPYYALFGQSFEYGDKPGDAVRTKWAASMVVHVTFDVGGEKYKISRYRGHKEFKNKVILKHFKGEKWDDVSGSSVAHTQSIINGILGISPQVFAYTGVFSDGVAKFPDLPDLEKKRIISEILGLEKCDKALKASKVKFQNLEEKKNLESAVLASNRKNLEDRLANYQSVKKSFDDWENGKDARVTALQQEKEAIQADLDKIASPQQVDEVQKYIRALQGQLSTLERLGQPESPHLESPAVEAEIATIKKSIATFSKNKKCGSCGREFENASEVDGHIEALNKKLAKLVEKLTLVKVVDEDETERYRAEKVKFDKRIKAINAVLAEQVGIKSAIETENRLLEASHARLVSKLAQVESKLSDESVNPFLALFQQADRSMQLVETGIAEKEASIRELDKEIEIEKQLIRLFGPKGCRTILIETVIPNVNAELKRMADIMAVPFDISLGVNTEEDGNAGNIKISVSNAKGADGYHGNSRGERRIMDVMILLALASTLQSRSTFAQVFFDETLESLHENYQAAVLRCIKTMFADRKSIYIISHHHAGLEEIDRVLRVQNGKLLT